MACHETTRSLVVSFPLLHVTTCCPFRKGVSSALALSLSSLGSHLPPSLYSRRLPSAASSAICCVCSSSRSSIVAVAVRILRVGIERRIAFSSAVIILFALVLSVVGDHTIENHPLQCVWAYLCETARDKWLIEVCSATKSKILIGSQISSHKGWALVSFCFYFC